MLSVVIELLCFLLVSDSFSTSSLYALYAGIFICFSVRPPFIPPVLILCEMGCRYCEPLRDLYDDREISQADPSLVSSDPSGAGRRSSFRQRFSKQSGVVSILRVIFSHFIKEVVEKMVGYVPLSSVMSKILADNGAQEFGDFKLTLLELLGTYGYERRILVTTICSL